MAFIREAHTKKQPVYAETCPQYLLLDNSKYTGTFEQTAPFVISPPLRTSGDNNALWDALTDGTISTLGTDHCPFTMDQKSAGINDFRRIPGGAGGVEHRLSLLYTYGLLTNRLTFNQIVNLYSSGLGGVSDRAVRITKMRRTNHKRGPVPFKITDDGIKVLGKSR